MNFSYNPQIFKQRKYYSQYLVHQRMVGQRPPAGYKYLKSIQKNHFELILWKQFWKGFSGARREIHITIKKKNVEKILQLEQTSIYRFLIRKYYSQQFVH